MTPEEREKLKAEAQKRAEQLADKILDLESIADYEDGCEHTEDGSGATCWHCRKARYEAVFTAGIADWAERHIHDAVAERDMEWESKRKECIREEREIRDDHWRRVVAAAEHRAEVAAHDAVAEERKALREVASASTCRRYKCYTNLLAALDAREKA